MATNVVRISRGSFLTRLSSIRIPPKIRNGRLKTVFNFCEAVFNDYTAVAMDVAQKAKDYPLKALIKGSIFGTFIVAYNTNPDKQQFQEQLVRTVDEMGLVGDMVRNPSSYEYVGTMHQLENEGLIRFLHFPGFTLMVSDDYKPQIGYFPSQCKYLKPRMPRIRDVGAFNTWWGLRYQVQDYDVNPTEWDGNLPSRSPSLRN